MKLGEVKGCAARGRSEWIDGNVCDACGSRSTDGCPEIVAIEAMDDYEKLAAMAGKWVELSKRLDDRLYPHTLDGLREDIRNLLLDYRPWAGISSGGEQE